MLELTPREQDIYIKALGDAKKADLLADRVNTATLICSIYNMFKKKRQPRLEVRDLIPEIGSLEKLPDSSELRTKIYAVFGAEPPKG